MSEGRSKEQMTDSVISVEEFERTRVARFDELEGSARPMLDAVIPGQEREIYQVIGKGVSEDREQKIPISDNKGFNGDRALRAWQEHAASRP